MSEYIEREKIWPALNAACVPYNRATAKAIEDIPAADVRPVWHGYNTGNARIFECSECGYGIADIFLTNERDYPMDPNFCPNCGADMREKS